MKQFEHFFLSRNHLKIPSISENSDKWDAHGRGAKYVDIDFLQDQVTEDVQVWFFDSHVTVSKPYRYGLKHWWERASKQIFSLFTFVYFYFLGTKLSKPG